jgi:exosortase D (VPLPA-CTERM-specific)
MASITSTRMRGIALAACVAVALGYAFRDGLARMIATWLTTEEYSHGIVLPFLAGWLIWQRRTEFARCVPHGSWWGLVAIAVGLAVNGLGLLATVYSLQQYAFLLCIYGLVGCLGGWQLLRALAAPMALLVLMVPLPNFFSNNLSAQLQLLSSQLGVWFIRAAGISVFLDGNVIDLGVYKLEVAEACSGLRYLFPLMTLGVVMGWLFQAERWKRALVFVSSVPLTIVMNSLRIGIIGVLVDRWGIAMAEGFLHDFEGWLMFMVTAALMLAEMAVLSRLGAHPRPLRESLHSLRDSGRAMAGNRVVLPLPLAAAALLLLVAAPAGLLLDSGADRSPQRIEFAQFPQVIGDWHGRRTALERVYLDVLQLDDYIMADYQADDAATRRPVNFYVAWYGSQRSGVSAHSPRSCLPGGGWNIRALQRVAVDGVSVGDQPLLVNRAVIEKGSSRQLVYYWFQQRGRVVTSEYAVKWYLFWDALTRRRTDGALVRLIVAVPEGATLEGAERELRRFAGAVIRPLQDYVPG